MTADPPPQSAHAPGRGASTKAPDERVRALLARRGPQTVTQLCAALRVSRGRVILSLLRLHGAGVVRRRTVRRGTDEEWEALPSD